MSSANKPIKAEWVKELEQKAKLADGLTTQLFRYAGETGRSEGAVATLNRLLRELEKRRSAATV